MADSTDLNDGEGETLSSEVRRSARRRILSSSGNSFYLQPTTTCREALHIITRAWNEAGLSCLPVATENGTGFQGMLTKHDILVSLLKSTYDQNIGSNINHFFFQGTIFAGPLDVALNATIGTVLSVRPRVCCPFTTYLHSPLSCILKACVFFHFIAYWMHKSSNVFHLRVSCCSTRQNVPTEGKLISVST